MKRYNMAFVDFSEIRNVTADAEQIELAKEKMLEYEILTPKGNPSTAAINKIAKDYLPQFFSRLNLRTARLKNGIVGIYETMKKLYERKDYMGFYLFLAIMYGFIQWRMPERIELLPASPEAMKIFSTECIGMFEKYIESNIAAKEQADE